MNDETFAAADRVERRFMPAGDVELRVSGDKPVHIVGYGARFNKDSVDMGFIETIKPGAFKNALKVSDVRGLKNHDPNLVLGRVDAGTMSLLENTRGLKYDIAVPDTSTGRDTAEEIRRGDITGSSFSFTIAEDGDEWTEKDGQYFRTITEFAQVFDVGPVTFPAYPDTSAASRAMTDADVALRSLEAFKESRSEAPVPSPDDEAKRKRPGPKVEQLALFVPAKKSKVEEALRKLKIEELKPVEALVKLEELKKLLDQSKRGNK